MIQRSQLFLIITVLPRTSFENRDIQSWFAWIMINSTDLFTDQSDPLSWKDNSTAVLVTPTNLMEPYLKNLMFTLIFSDFSTSRCIDYSCHEEINSIIQHVQTLHVRYRRHQMPHSAITPFFFSSIYIKKRRQEFNFNTSWTMKTSYLQWIRSDTNEHHR